MTLNIPRHAVSRRVAAPFVLLFVAIASGCAVHYDVTVPAVTGSRMMPNPTGCFVLVADEPAFAGRREYLNGPTELRTLRDLYQRQDWRRRIRSASAGPGATVTIWTDEQLKGMSMTLRSGDTHDRLPAPFDKTVESVSIACTAPNK